MPLEDDDSPEFDEETQKAFEKACLEQGIADRENSIEAKKAEMADLTEKEMWDLTKAGLPLVGHLDSGREVIEDLCEGLEDARELHEMKDELEEIRRKLDNLNNDTS